MLSTLPPSRIAQGVALVATLACGSTPRFILDSCGADGVYFSIVGTTLELPGRVQVMELGFRDPKTGQGWQSDQVEFEVSEFGAVGARGIASGTSATGRELARLEPGR